MLAGALESRRRWAPAISCWVAGWFLGAIPAPAGPDDCVPPQPPEPACLEAPAKLISDHTTLRTLVLVKVFDCAGKPIPWTPVDFEAADPLQVAFPYPRAFTNARGVAANVVVRAVEDAVGVMTTIRVSAGPNASSSIPIEGINLIVDGTPYGFSAPPLEPFQGSRQHLVGRTFLFRGLPLPFPVQAWSINPAIAEPSTGTITGNPAEGHVLQFDVTARSLGETVFIIDTIDLALYPAIISGDLAPPFLRGDADEDGAVTIADALHILGHLFLGEQPASCLQAEDVNDDAAIDISDPLYILSHLFLGIPAPPPPFPEKGQDPTPDELEC